MKRVGSMLIVFSLVMIIFKTIHMINDSRKFYASFIDEEPVGI